MVSRGGGRKRSAPGESGAAVKRGKKCGLCGVEGKIVHLTRVSEQKLFFNYCLETNSYWKMDVFIYYSRLEKS